MKTSRLRAVFDSIFFIAIFIGVVCIWNAWSFDREYKGFSLLGAEKSIHLASMEFPSDRLPVTFGQEVDFTSQTSSTSLSIYLIDNYKPGKPVDLSQFPDDIAGQIRRVGQQVDIASYGIKPVGGQDWLTYDATVTAAKVPTYNHVGVTVSDTKKNEIFIFDVKSPKPLIPADLTIFQKMLVSIKLAKD